MSHIQHLHIHHSMLINSLGILNENILVLLDSLHPLYMSHQQSTNQLMIVRLVSFGELLTKQTTPLHFANYTKAGQLQFHTPNSTGWQYLSMTTKPCYSCGTPERRTINKKGKNSYTRNRTAKIKTGNFEVTSPDGVYVAARNSFRSVQPVTETSMQTLHCVQSQ